MRAFASGVFPSVPFIRPSSVPFILRIMKKSVTWGYILPLLERDVVVRNCYSSALPLLNINVIEIYSGAVACHNQFARTFPVQIQAATSCSKDDSVTVVCVSKLGWRKQVISNQYEISVAA